MREDRIPHMEVQNEGTAHEKEVYTHDAFGVVRLSEVQGGGKTTLFGSDIGHSSMIRISVSRAKLDRHLSSDWIHDTGMPLVEFQMSHAQFAQFITSVGKGSGTPCTLLAAPANGTKTEQMPGLENIESKHDLLRREIKDSATKQTEKIAEMVAKLGAMIESGKMGKKEMKELHFSLKCAVENVPSNMAFVVKQAEEALEKATADAKIEIESFMDMTTRRIGSENLQALLELQKSKKD